MKPAGPATIIGADRLRSHDMGIVVDLDPSRRAFEAKGRGEGCQKLLLRGRLGQFAAQRLARILRGVIDELALFATLRRGDLDAMAGA